MEPENADPQKRDAKDRERRHLRPQHLEADALQECPADDDQVVGHRVDVRQPLHEIRHAGDRKAEAGKDEGRIDDEEIGGEGLLLRPADGRDQEADPEHAEKIERGSEQKDERIAAERDLEPERADGGDHDVRASPTKK